MSDHAETHPSSPLIRPGHLREPPVPGETASRREKELLARRRAVLHQGAIRQPPVIA
jgi:hypothetical protein